MPETEFLIFEVLNYLLFAGCVWHAHRQGKTRLLELLVSVLYGVFLEWMTIQQLEAYQYGHFLVMVDGAPLCIGLGWAVIIYSGMEFVRLLEMPDFARPFLVGFMALNLDLAMDVVAIRLGFWNWVIPMDAEWFGVPWGNFWAWYIVVVSYSGLLYWLRALGWHLPRQTWRQWVYAPLAMAGSVVILALANAIFANVFAKTEIVSAMSMLLLLLVGMVVVYVARPRFSVPARLDWPVFAVPLVFHLYFNFIGFWNGYYLQLPVLAVVGMLMLALGIGIHFGCWYFPMKEQKNKLQTV